ncbi:Kunitz trypsin inhibitor [Tanacetum coccineum]
MKSATLFLVSVLVFAFTSPSLSVSVHTVDDDLVLDAGGNPIQKGVDYMISLPGWGALGGSLQPAPPVEKKNVHVEDDVLLLRFENRRSGALLVPRSFTPVKSSEDVIKLGHPLAVQSPSDNPYGDSTVWKVSTRDGLLTSIITTGGIINTGPAAVGFKLHPTDQLQTHKYICI